MPHRESIQNSTLIGAMPTANHIYTVSSNVGYGCRNHPEDVRLVQFFINAIMDTTGTDWKTKPKKRLVTDGLFGGNTWSAIRSFQKFTLEAVVDGAITAVNGKKLEGSNHHKIFTMYYLNWYYYLDREQHFNDIRTDPDLPSELRNFLSGPLPDLL